MDITPKHAKSYGINFSVVVYDKNGVSQGTIQVVRSVRIAGLLMRQLNRYCDTSGIVVVGYKMYISDTITSLNRFMH